MEEDKQLDDQQRSLIRKTGLKSWVWSIAGTALGAAITYYLLPIAMGGSLLAGVGTAIAGSLAIFSAYKAFTTDMDQSIGFEELNAQRTAKYTAKAIVQEMKKEGIGVVQTPEHSDGKSWREFVQQDTPQSQQTERFH